MNFIVLIHVEKFIMKNIKNCINIFTKLSKILEPLRIEVYLNSQNFREEIQIFIMNII